jgi:IclR family acetate operon transcriptional repressor
VAVIHKALDMLELLAETPLTAAELSVRTDVAKPTVYRILHTLQSRGFLTKEVDSARFLLGPAFHTLGTATHRAADLITLARPLMLRLASEFGETVNLAIPSNGQVFYIDVLESGHRLRTHIPIGTRDHLHSTALGKAILAGLPESEARVILNTIDRVQRTPNTLVTVSALLRQSVAIRERGYAIDNEENELGSVCVASTFCNYDDRPIGAISVSGPRSRIAGDLVDVIGNSLVESCKLLSDHLASPDVVPDHSPSLSSSR